MTTTEWTPTRQTEWTFTPLGWGTNEDDYLLWGTDAEDILLYALFEETDWELYDTDTLEIWTLETYTWLPLEDSTWEDIIFNTGIISDSTERDTFTY